MKSTSVLIIFIIMAIGCHAKSSLRIVGGKDASPENYHYIVRIEEERKHPGVAGDLNITHHHSCTGTVLTSTWVLTAAHCIDGYLNSLRIVPKLRPRIIIRYGSALDVPGNNDSFSIVVKMVMHPSYRYLEIGVIVKFPYHHNDIGLLKTSPIELDRYGKLSAIDYSTLVGLPISAFGYGGTRDGDTFGDTLELSKPLQTLDLLVTKCSKTTLHEVYPVLCLSRRCGESAASVCPGDSGGPLLHSSGVVGVNSMAIGFNCFHNDLNYRSGKRIWSSTGTPVSPYIQWISEHIKDST